VAGATEFANEKESCAVLAVGCSEFTADAPHGIADTKSRPAAQNMLHFTLSLLADVPSCR
jgi:hypothetical protein